MSDNFYNRYGIAPQQGYDGTSDLQVSNNKNRQSIQENTKRISKRYGADFYSALNGLYSALTGKTLNTDKVLNVIDILAKLKEDMTKKYLYCLMFPEKTKGCR